MIASRQSQPVHETKIVAADFATCLHCHCDFAADGRSVARRHGIPWLVCPICDHAAGRLLALSEMAHG